METFEKDKSSYLMLYPQQHPYDIARIVGNRKAFIELLEALNKILAPKYTDELCDLLVTNNENIKYQILVLCTDNHQLENTHGNL
jgi:hypothetical protein